MKNIQSGKLWYLHDDGAFGEYVVALGVDQETQDARLAEYKGDRSLKYFFKADVTVVGVKEIVPKHDVDPMDFTRSSEERYNSVRAARTLAEEYMADRDSAILADLAQTLAVADTINLALAMYWLVRDRWVVQYYRLRRRDDGTILDDWWSEPSDIPDEIYDGGVKLDLNQCDIVTQYLKTVRFGK